MGNGKTPKNKKGEIKMKKSLIAIIALTLAVLMLGLVGCSAGNSGENDGKSTGKIILIDKDEKEYTYDVKFDDGMSLRAILLENELITEEEAAAFFIQTIDGHLADVENDGCTWQPHDANKNMIVGTTFDDITMKNGDTIYLIYYVVPNFDD